MLAPALRDSNPHPMIESVDREFGDQCGQIVGYDTRVVSRLAFPTL